MPSETMNHPHWNGAATPTRPLASASRSASPAQGHTLWCLRFGSVFFQDGLYDLGEGRALSLADRVIKLSMALSHETVAADRSGLVMEPETTSVKIDNPGISFSWAN